MFFFFSFNLLEYKPRTKRVRVRELRQIKYMNNGLSSYYIIRIASKEFKQKDVKAAVAVID